jgi:hypothetical protein
MDKSLVCVVSQVRLRRVCDVTARGLAEALPFQDQRLPRPGEPLPHRSLLQGPNPYGLRTFLGAETAELHGARVQVRVPGSLLKQATTTSFHVQSSPLSALFNIFTWWGIDK